ncbi:MAG: hypothetical protein HY000_08470 [Planctomycetes bacterium]|nr:hypothetical protein [Planctomycetota bacterium]
MDKGSRSELKHDLEPAEELVTPMTVRGISDRLTTMLAAARRVLNETESDAVLLFSEWPLDWRAIREELGDCKLLIAAPLEGTSSSDSATDELPARLDARTAEHGLAGGRGRRTAPARC